MLLLSLTQREKNNPLKTFGSTSRDVALSRREPHTAERFSSTHVVQLAYKRRK
jgi:hypothetical protein